MTQKVIHPYTTKLDQVNARTMALLSNLVYKKGPEASQKPDEKGILVELKKQDSGFLSVKGFDKNSAQAMVVGHTGFVAIAFRGTNEIADWLDNLNAFPEKTMFGEFHRGFYRSVEDLWEGPEGIMQQVKEVGKNLPLFITGHSLGGAMASIAAAKRIHEDKPFTSVYTFGQPRAMTRETSRIFNSEAGGRYFRFQNNEDIVTRVPARLMNYSHVGQCLYIDQDKKIHTDPGFWFKFLDTVGGALESIRDAKSIMGISDHDINDYLEAVKTWDCED